MLDVRTHALRRNQLCPAVRQRRTLNMKPKPNTSGCGGRKFLRPRIMKEPVGRYSPVGAALDTCTQHASHVHVHMCDNLLNLSAACRACGRHVLGSTRTCV